MIKNATEKLPEKNVESALAEVIEALDGLDKEEENDESIEEKAINSVSFDVADEEDEEQTTQLDEQATIALSSKLIVKGVAKEAKE